MTQNTNDTAPDVQSDAHRRKRRPGAPRRNRNALRHGLRTCRLPAKCKHVEISLDILRREAEDALLATGRTIGLTEAAYISSMVRHEKRAMLAERWLRENADLPLTERLAMLKAASDASDSRDRCIERLKLNEQPVDVWANAITTQLASPSVTETDADDANDYTQQEVTSDPSVSVSADVSETGTPDGPDEHADLGAESTAEHAD